MPAWMTSVAAGPPLAQKHAPEILEHGGIVLPFSDDLRDDPALAPVQHLHDPHGLTLNGLGCGGCLLEGGARHDFLKEGVNHDGGLVRPPGIDRGLTDPGLARNALDGEVLQGHVFQQADGRVEDGFAGHLTAGSAGGAFGGDGSTRKGHAHWPTDGHGGRM